MEAQVTEARPRGREATRQRLLEAARALFSEHGYELVTVRQIAAAADANIALVGRYFGSKAGLFGAVLEGEPTIARIFDGDPSHLPRRLAEYAAARMNADPESPILRSLERSAGDPEIQALVRERLNSAVIGPLSEQLTASDAHARARMATAVFLGIGSMRRVLGPEPATAADVDRLAAMFEICLTESPHGG
ncbi:MAG: TetR family transcriptional regulator [Nonomuraea sp.]|nr:TetR family transcriptional regulator [Nonomuraea sp.]